MVQKSNDQKILEKKMYGSKTILVHKTLLKRKLGKKIKYFVKEKSLSKKIAAKKY